MSSGGLEFHVEAGPNDVHAWSTLRLPYEPRGAMKAYREELRSALRSLHAGPGDGLVATYEAPDCEFADVENVALYNVGSGPFGRLVGEGLVCRRGTSLDDLHHLKYQVTSALPDPAEGTPGVPFAWVSATDPVPVPPGTTKPNQWWRLIRPRLEVSDARMGPAPFAVDVTLGGNWRGTAVVNVVKGLLDGLVAALGCHDGSGVESLLSRLAMWGDPDQLWQELCDAGKAVLGPRSLVRTYRQEGLAWNPADELCESFRFTVDRARPNRQVWLRATWL